LRSTTLTGRHADILVLLSRHPEGLSADHLAVLLDDKDLVVVTVRRNVPAAQGDRTGVHCVTALPTPGTHRQRRRRSLRCKGLTIRGSIVGTRQDMAEALDFYARGLIHPTVASAGLDEINDVFAKMERGQIDGRIVIDYRKRANFTGLTRRTRCTIAPSSNQPVGCDGGV